MSAWKLAILFLLVFAVLAANSDKKSSDEKQKKEGKKNQKENFAKNMTEKLFPKVLANAKSEDMTTFDVNAREIEDVFQYVPSEIVPSRVYLAYFVSSSKKEHINLRIYSPEGKELKAIEAENQGYALVDAETAGYYRIEFNNKDVRPLKQGFDFQSRCLGPKRLH